MPTAELIEPGFSLADAEHPSMSYEGGDLILMFVDWRERSVRVTFRDVCRFEWSDEPVDYFDGEPPDGTCVVLNSGWIPSIANRNCQHYRLNFNACGGRLEIACGAIEVAET